MVKTLSDSRTGAPNGARPSALLRSPGRCRPYGRPPVRTPLPAPSSADPSAKSPPAWPGRNDRSGRRGRLVAVGRQEQQRRAEALVARESAGARDDTHGEPDQAGVERQAREGTLRGLGEPLVEFDQVKAHARPQVWDATALHPV